MDSTNMSTLNYLRSKYERGPSPSKWSKIRNHSRGTHHRQELKQGILRGQAMVRRQRLRTLKWDKARSQYGIARAKLAYARRNLVRARRERRNAFGRTESLRRDSNNSAAPPMVPPIVPIPPVAITPIATASSWLRDIGTTQLPLTWNIVWIFLLSCVAAAGLLTFVYAAANASRLSDDHHGSKSKVPYHLVSVCGFIVFMCGLAPVVYLLRTYPENPQVIVGRDPERGIELHDLHPHPQQPPEPGLGARPVAPDDPIADVLDPSAYDEDHVVTEFGGVPGQAH